MRGVGVVVSVWLVALGLASSAWAAGGPVFTWGEGSVLGDGFGKSEPMPEAVNLAPGVSPTVVSAGQSHGLAIGSDGKLYGWGPAELGGAPSVTTVIPEVVTLAPGVAPTAIATGYEHSLAIGSDHKLYAWGDNDGSELGDGTKTPEASPEPITLAPGVSPVAIAAGYGASLAIGSDGHVYGWGTEVLGYHQLSLSGQKKSVLCGHPEIVS